MERTCGGCTACCKTHAIFEIGKAPGQWCPHCEIGKGCKIYGERPKECREYQCQWRTGIGGPRFRPDKTKIVPEHREIPGIGMAMWFFEVSEGALNSNFARKWTLRNLILGNCVMRVSLTARNALYLPKRVDGSGLAFRFENSQELVEVVQYPESALRCAK